jgi:small subunit ribosomal protein S20
MPIQRAAFKSVRKDKKRRQRNLRITSELKTLEKRFSSYLNAKKASEAKEILALLVSKIGKAAGKGILHRNTASRQISRLKIRLNKLEKGQ